MNIYRKRAWSDVETEKNHKLKFTSCVKINSTTGQYLNGHTLGSHSLIA